MAKVPSCLLHKTVSFVFTDDSEIKVAKQARGVCKALNFYSTSL